MLSRETSDWSLKRRGDSLGEEQFGDFEEDKDLDEDFDDELDEEDDEFRPKKGPGPRRDWE